MLRAVPLDDGVNILFTDSLASSVQSVWQMVLVVVSYSELLSEETVTHAGLHFQFLLVKLSPLSLSVFQMTAGLCVCVVLAVLCTSCLGLPFSSQLLDEGQRSISAPSEGTNLSPRAKTSH